MQIPEGVTRDSGKTRRAPAIVDALDAAYDGGVLELDWETPFQLLVATILAARSTDATINRVTPGLFAAFPDPAAFLAVDEATLQEHLRPTGFFRQKTRAVRAVCAVLLERFGGEVPETMAELVSLPGVARKTANVVQTVAFPAAHAADPDAGVIVDTHVTRLARRLRFTREEDPVRIERDLRRLLPRERWGPAALSLILHGRRVCDARRPRCGGCAVEALCPSSLVDGRRDKAGQAVGLG